MVLMLKKMKTNVASFKEISFVPIHCLGCVVNGLPHVLRERMHKLIDYINKSNFTIQAP